ncbi:MAG: NAD(P)-dependent glycerol-3-phosphate dehydrogenase [Zoogloeaceae bacterium]|jgi:glycerol-3-phosphate dehydrogenase (NAD(P)+)|nr:NAD(P)-dependent glycerol-3-phosphate dehydrogenase [Zoogloeaceae bacterium]
MKISVLAAGAWGTALALTFAARHEVTLWAREASLVAEMRARRENRRYLPGFPFPDALRVEGDLRQATQGAELFLLATPIAGLRTLLRTLSGLALRTPFLWVCKGFEAEEDSALPHEIVEAELPGIPCGALAGPSFAREVAAGLPTAILLASRDRAFARALVDALHGGSLRLYVSDDLIGVEVGGAVKNILAIAAGVSDGLDLGSNARAALITRGLAEVARLGSFLGGRKETFMGLSGMGDLILTSTGDLSRNRQVGLGLAAGKALVEIQAELGHVAEGVHTAFAVRRLAERLGVEMPISTSVAALLEGRLSLQDAVGQLLSRDPKEETA